jgi:serine/threonine-protein kinase ULK/ATG1
MDSPRTTDPLIGSMIQNYRIIERLGSGSFATVYRAEHVKTLTGVAIKAISRKSVASKEEFSLLQREVDLMKGMDHPFIAFLYDVISDHFFFLIRSHCPPTFLSNNCCFGISPC